MQGFNPSARHPRDAGLLLFDLDDTIVQSGSYVSPRVIQALAAARDAGFVLSVASGRPLCSVPRKLLQSGVMDYAVCSNGATITRLDNGELLAHCPLGQEDALSCYRSLRAFRPAWNAFLDNKALFEWKGASYMLTGRTGAVARTMRGEGASRGVPRRIARLVYRGMRYVGRMLANRSHRQVRSVLPSLEKAHAGVDKMGCTIPDGHACAQAAQLLRDDGRFEVVRMGKTELEITARGITKGAGAGVLMEMLGIDERNAYAFGDGGNDLPLSQVVGCFVAMGNADAEVKEAADAVCPPVGEDGVAAWIEENLLGANPLA